MTKKAKGILFGTAIATIGVLAIRFIKRKIRLSETNLNRQSQYYDALLDWIDNMQGNRRIDAFLLENGYKKIAVYGKGTLGFLLYRELQNADVTIEFFMDQTADEYSSNVEGIPVIKKEELDKMEEVDAIIVTPIHAYENIRKDLEGMGVTIPVISLNEAILEAK